MIEKVNPAHPDKIADRIAGAIVDIAYKVEDDPTIAVEVLIGHGWRPPRTCCGMKSSKPSTAPLTVSLGRLCRSC